MAQDLNLLKVSELKEKCRSLGLPVGRKKADLIARIQSKTAQNAMASGSATTSATTTTTSSLQPSQTAILTPKVTPKKKPAARLNARKAISKTLPETTAVTALKKPKTPPNGPKKFAVQPRVGQSSATAIEKTKALTAKKEKDVASTNKSSAKKRDFGVIAKETTQHSKRQCVENTRVFQKGTDESSICSTPGLNEQVSSVATSQALTFLDEQKSSVQAVHVQTVENRGQNTKSNITKALPDKAPAKAAKYLLGPATSIPLQKCEASLVRQMPWQNGDASRNKKQKPRLAMVSANLKSTRDTLGGTATAELLENHQDMSLFASEDSGCASIDAIEKTDHLMKPGQQLEGLVPPSKKTKKVKLNVKPMTPSATLPQATAILNLHGEQWPADNDISVKLIGNPPRAVWRKQINKLSLMLALTAYSSIIPCLNVEGIENRSYDRNRFLTTCQAACKDWRYAGVLAYYHLLMLEFPGRRTNAFMKKKDTDLTDFRPYYLQRVLQRQDIVRKLKVHWVERTWRFLLANFYNSNVLSTNKYGLFFEGINELFLSEPDHVGQFKVAMRFWIQRFTFYCNGGATREMLRMLQAERIVQVQPVQVKLESKQLSTFLVWQIDTQDGSRYFIVGDTGEVVGWRDMHVSNVPPDSQGMRRASTLQSGRSSCPDRLWTSSQSSSSLLDSKIPNFSWTDLRQDWKACISSAASSLLDFVFCPKPTTFTRGIHNSIVLRRHAVAQTFILNHCRASGISGTPLFEIVDLDLRIVSDKHQSLKMLTRVQLDVDSKWAVESVKCSGESHAKAVDASRQRKVLAPGIAMVQTPEMGWYILEETGQEIAEYENGIVGMWATILGVDDRGHALNAEELQGLAKYFIFPEVAHDNKAYKTSSLNSNMLEIPYGRKRV